MFHPGTWGGPPGSSHVLANPGKAPPMLSLRLRLAELRSTTWRWQADGWTNGGSEIRPFQHPAVAARLVWDRQGRVVAIVQERTRAASADAPNDMQPHLVPDARTVARQCERSPGNWMTVQMEPGRVAVACGAGGTAPLYLATRGDLVLGSWDLLELRPVLSPDRLLARAVARRLARQARYTNDTVLGGVQRLTERSSATFTRSGLVVSYPQAAEHVVQPRAIRPGVDVVAAFGQLLAAVVSETPAAAGPVGVELSGGADSANVAVTLAALRDEPVASYGLVLDGVMGEQQRARRAAIVNRLGLRDRMVSAFAYPPFEPLGVRGRGGPHDPMSAYYREAFDALRDAVVGGGTRVICTGLGGDELMARHPHERTGELPEAETVPWLGLAARAALADVDANLAPVPTSSMTALMAQASHNPAYLAAGIWPVAPLADPRLVRFGEQLPLEWRAGKRLLRERLRRVGLAEEVVNPLVPETFSDLMQVGLRRYGLPILKDMLASSRLVDLGYVDHGALARAYEAAMTSAVVPSTLCDALSLEVGLASLDAGGCAS